MMNIERLRPLGSLLLLFLVAPISAALMSPWIYQFLQSFAAEDSVLDAPFHRVTSRVVLVMVAALLVPAYKLSGLKGRDNWGLPKCENRRKQLYIGGGVGIVSMLIVYFAGVALGVFQYDTKDDTLIDIILEVGQIILGGLFIGVFEEILFRGYIQNALKKSLGIVASILIGSLFFSAVHFMRPTDPEVMGEWYSGFLLFKNLFGRAGTYFAQEATTLFCMGTVLATLSYWMKSVYVAIGLHAGWVWVMMFFRLFCQNQKNMVWLYGKSDWVSKAWIGPAMAIVVWIGVLLTRKYWKKLGSGD